jgi:hypothetical protein
MLPDLLQAIFKITLYVIPGLGAGALQLRTLQRRANAKGNDAISDDDAFGVFFTGLFWPIGLWIAIAYCFTLSKRNLAKRPDYITKDQIAREQRILHEREDLRLSIEQHKNDLAIADFHARQMREIEGTPTNDALHPYPNPTDDNGDGRGYVEFGH